MRFGVRDWRGPSLASELVSGVATAGAASARRLHLGEIGPHFSLAGTAAGERLARRARYAERPQRPYLMLNVCVEKIC